jgi:hypothetical protein
MNEFWGRAEETRSNGSRIIDDGHGTGGGSTQLVMLFQLQRPMPSSKWPRILLSDALFRFNDFPGPIKLFFPLPSVVPPIPFATQIPGGQQLSFPVACAFLPFFPTNYARPPKARPFACPCLMSNIFPLSTPTKSNAIFMPSNCQQTPHFHFLAL